MNKNNINNIAKLCKIIKLSKITDIINITPNTNKIKQNKGFIGQLIERFFNIKNNNKPYQDLKELGIEIKTIPLNQNLLPKEKTYICTVNKNINFFNWRSSHLYKKINTILWIPYEGCKKIPFKEKKILIPFIYKISKLDEKKLKQEWLEIIENYFYNKKITINSLEYLEINAKKKIKKNIDKITIYKNYNAFYLKKKFTKEILKKIKYEEIIKIYRERDLNSHNY